MPAWFEFAWLVYPLFGALAGLIAGLLGVGGGIVVVPALVYLFAAQGLPPEHIMKMALGTSMAAICFTSISSFRAHSRRGAVLWHVVAAVTPGILIGTFGGSWVAARLSTLFLKCFFALFLYFVCAQMLLDLRPQASRGLPGRAGMLGAGGVIGVVSALVGIGGGTLSVPFMTWCNVALHQAIGTSAAIGFPIAVGGSLGYIFNGLDTPNLPPMSLGYVYLPALVGVATVSVLTAPHGARLAHALPVRTLRRCFAGFLVLVASKMMWEVARKMF